jgi:hypothetical protein
MYRCSKPWMGFSIIMSGDVILDQVLDSPISILIEGVGSFIDVCIVTVLPNQ